MEDIFEDDRHRKRIDYADSECDDHLNWRDSESGEDSDEDSFNPG